MKHAAKNAAAATVLLAVPAFAQGPGWTVPSTVIEVVNTVNGGMDVRLSPDLAGCTSQSNYGGAFASVYPSHAGIDRIKADVLVAFTTGAHIALYLSDATCTVGETRMTQ